MNPLRLAFSAAALASLATALVPAYAQETIKIGEINSYKAQPAFLDPYKKGMDLAVEEIPLILGHLLVGLERWLAAPAGDVLEAWARRDALVGRAVRWADGGGTAAGVDEDGRLIVRCDDGRRVALEAGEVHLEPR